MAIRGINKEEVFELISIRDGAIDADLTGPENLLVYDSTNDRRILKMHEDAKSTIFYCRPIMGKDMVIIDYMYSDLAATNKCKRDDYSNYNKESMVDTSEMGMKFAQNVLKKSIIKVENIETKEGNFVTKKNETDDDIAFLFDILPSEVQVEIAHRLFYLNHLSPEDKKKLELLLISIIQEQSQDLIAENAKKTTKKDLDAEPL